MVFAQLEVGGTSEGVHAFVVPIREDGAALPGVRIEDDGAKMGLNGVDNGRIWFDGVRVPRTALLNRFADVTPAGVYESDDREPQPALLHHARHPGPGPRLRRRRGDQRRQGRADHRDEVRRAAPAVRGDLGGRGGAAPRLRHAPAPAVPAAGPDLRAALRPGGRRRPAARRVLGRSTDDEHARRELESRAAGTKALGTWHATRTIQECREACGGAGYLSVNRFAALKADTDVFTTFEGDNHVLLQLVAKGLLTDYASEFEDMDQFGMVRFVAGMAVETVIEQTNVHKLLERIKDVLPGGDQWDQEAGLLDPDYQLAMLRFREEHMLAGVARRLKRGIDHEDEPRRGLLPGAGPRDRARPAPTSSGWCSRRSWRRSRSLPDGDHKVALNLLCDLHALSTIEADRAWFMEHGRLTAARSKAISREINNLCRKIRPLAGRPRRRVRRTRGDAALAGPDRRLMLPAEHEDPRPRRLERGPAVGRVLRLDRRAPASPAAALAGRASAATWACSTTRPPRSAASRRAPGSSTSRAAAVSRCAGCGPARACEYVAADISQTMLDRTLAAPGGAGWPTRSTAAARGRGGAAVRRRRPSTWWSRSPGCTASRTRRGRSSRSCGCSRPGGVAHRQRAAQRHRAALRAGPRRAGRLRRAARPGVHRRAGA